MKNCNHCTSTDAQLKAALTEISFLKKQLTKAMRTNVLTGLPNKVSCEEHLQEAAKAASRQTTTSTFVFFTDLDNFKTINDTCSHEFGDEVLKATANIYAKILRDSDYIFHISGDEFIIQAEVDCASGAEKIKAKIQTAIDALELSFNNKTVKLGVSIGYTEIVAHQKVSNILEMADKNLAKNKNARLKKGLRFKR